MLSDFPWQTGRGNLPKLSLATPSGDSAEIYRHGAHLTSWKTRSGREWMFLSERAVFATGNAIRGGVPVIFPQFSGFGAGQRHGFVRNIPWQLLRSPSEVADGQQCTFVLNSDQETLAHWPYRFHAEFTPELTADQLKMTLTIRNIDDNPFTFTAALHSYFTVNNVHEVQLNGLKGLSYWDNDGSNFHNDRKIEEKHALQFPAAIDRVYFNCRQPLQLIDGDEQLHIQAQGFEEVVVWNPGAEATKKLSDMADEEYRRMLCVEAAIIDKPITLAPGETWNGTQVLWQAAAQS